MGKTLDEICRENGLTESDLVSYLKIIQKAVCNDINPEMLDKALDFIRYINHNRSF